MTPIATKRNTHLVGAFALLGCLFSVLYAVQTEPRDPSPSNEAALRDAQPAPPAIASKPSDSKFAEQAEVVAANDTSRTNVLARSAAQPIMTLAGHLEQRARALPWGERGKVQRSPDITLPKALESPLSNPNNKILDIAAQRELAELLAKLDLAYEEQSLEVRRLQKEALIRAIARGNIRSLADTTQVADPNDIFALAAASQSNSKDMMARMQVLIREMETTYGPMMKDWNYSNMTSSEPDGVGRNNIVYWTRAEEPELFQQQDQFGALQKHHWNVVREFIDRH